MKTTINTLRNEVEAINNGRSKWRRAIKEDALYIIDSMQEALNINDTDTLPESVQELKAIALNGAEDWKQYSWGGCALVYNDTIKAHYLTDSEIRRHRGEIFEGMHLLDLQAWALSQAWQMVLDAFRRIRATRIETGEQRNAAKVA